MAETNENKASALAPEASFTNNNLPGSSNTEISVLQSIPMAKTILKKPVQQETCLLELQVKSESIVEKKVEHQGDHTAEKNDCENNKSQNTDERPVNEIVLPQNETHAVDGAFDAKSLALANVPDAALSDKSLEDGDSKEGFLFERKEGFLHFLKMLFFKIFGRFFGIWENKQKRFLHDKNLKVLLEHDVRRVLDEKQIINQLNGENEKVFLPGIVEEVSTDLVRYWLCRYTLFSRFDEGIKLDGQGLFSVTPEEIAKKQAARCGRWGTVIDAFTGAGGNAIQFACMNFDVIAIDIDPKKIEYATNNARVYDVANRIDFIVGDFFQLAPTMKADVVFLSPPWGGPEYIKAEKYDIKTMLEPADGVTLFKLALSVAPSVVYFLPKTVDPDQLEELSLLTEPPLRYEIEKNYVQDELKAVTVYFGKIVG